MADDNQGDIAVELEQVQKKVRDSLERANELVCEARLALRQQEERKSRRPSRE